MLSVRLVIDTNVLVSAALKPDSLQRTTFLTVITKPARLYVSLRFSRNMRTCFRVASWGSGKGFASSCFSS